MRDAAPTPTRRLLLRRAAAGALPLLGAGLLLLPPAGPALAEPASPLPLALPVPSRELLERYNAWLYQERRILAAELHPDRGEEAQRWIADDPAVNLFHFRLAGGRLVPSPASARAVPLLWALGLAGEAPRG